MVKKVLFLLLSLCLSHNFLRAQAVMLDTAKSRFAKIDDVKIHYKVWGKGEPVLLLHGAMEYWKEWKNQIPALAKEYKVIAVDTRGHGESSFTDRELNYELLADDMLAFLKELKLDSVNVVGYGDGGITAMIMAMKSPHSVKKLVAIGSNLNPDTSSVYPEVLEKVRAWDIDKMAFYLEVKFKENPYPKGLKVFAKRMQTLLLTQPHLTYDDLDKVKCPALIMCGDHDLIKLTHTAFIYENLPNGYLCVIPGSTHYCIKEKPSVVNAAIKDFLQYKPIQLKRF
jgi:pimeloyl-ACP methyl ester carboxylesterase